MCRLGREAFQKWRSGVIYIVEVLERMLTLAANRLSMIALKEKNERENGCIGGNEMKGAKREKRKKKSNTSQQLFIYWNWALHCQDSRSKLKGKDIWWEFKKRKRDGKLNFITTFALPPFPERGAVKEVIYIYGKRTVAIFHDTWLIDGISSACS